MDLFTHYRGVGIGLLIGAVVVVGLPTYAFPVLLGLAAGVLVTVSLITWRAAGG